MAPARVVESVRKIVQFREGSLNLGSPIILNTGFWGLRGFGGGFEAEASGIGAADAADAAYHLN